MRKFAVFDIDGTLIRWQLYHAVVDKLAKQNLLGGSAHSKIHQARMKWKNREANYGFSEYEVELISEFEKALTKVNPIEFDLVVKQVIDEYKDQTYTFTKNLMHSLKSQDYFLLAISGSQQELVQKIADYYQFDAFVGTEYRQVAKKYTGEKTFPAQDKKQSLQKLIKKFKLTLEGSYAVGDSKSDAPMLEMVENPIAFNPDRNLYDIATKNHWPIVIERKNVIYRLEHNNSSYILSTNSL